MLDYLKFKNIKYNLLINKYQTLKNNDKIRFFGVAKATKKPSKWINKVEKFHWFYLFSEKKNEKIVYFYIEVDYNDVAIEKRYYC